MTDEQFARMEARFERVSADIQRNREHFDTELQSLRVDMLEGLTGVKERLAAVEARLDAKADKGEVFRSILLVNTAMFAVIGVAAALVRTFDLI